MSFMSEAKFCALRESTRAVENWRFYAGISLDSVHVWLLHAF